MLSGALRNLSFPSSAVASSGLCDWLLANQAVQMLCIQEEKKEIVLINTLH